MEKVIVTAALTGAVTPKDLNPNIPLDPQEIAEDAVRCYKAGASVVHLHMRDEKGIGTMDKDRFKTTVDLIRKECDLVVNLTTSGEAACPDERRWAHLIEIKPEMGSYDSGTFNWMPKGVFMNRPEFLENLAKVMMENGVKPEVEVFDSGMLHNAVYYMKQGLIKAPAHFQFCLGVGGASTARVEDLVFLKNLLPAGSTWSAFGVGRNHLPILYAAIAMGGHVRVGIEDNVYYSKGNLASNVDFVERAVRLIREFGKEPATPDDAREILSLKK